MVADALRNFVATFPRTNRRHCSQTVALLSDLGEGRTLPANSEVLDSLGGKLRKAL